MSPLKKLAGQTAIYGLSSVIGRLLNYLLVPLYTRYFIPEEYGVVTELYAYVAFLVVILTYGLEIAFFRFSKKEQNKRIVYSTSLISLFVTSTVFISLMVFFSGSIAETIQYKNNPEYVVWFAIIIGLDAISSISFAKLREQNKATRFALIRLVNIFVNIGLNLFFIIYCPYAIEQTLSSKEFVTSIYNPSIGVGYIFIANLIASLVTILMLIPEMLKSVWVFDYILWKKMMVYAIPLLIAGLAGITNETIDRVLLRHFLPSNTNIISEIGIYGALYKLSIIMTLFIQTFRFAAEPFFFAQEHSINSKKTYADVMKYFTIIMAVIFLIVTIYYDFIKGFLGDRFIGHPDGSLVVTILLLANLFLGIYYNLSIWYKLTEKTIFGAYLSIFGAGITIILNIMLIPKIGFLGSAWATLACYFCMTITSYYFGKKYYPIPYQINTITGYLFLMIILFGLSKYLSLGIILNTIYILIFVAIVLFFEKPKKNNKNITPKLFD